LIPAHFPRSFLVCVTAFHFVQVSGNGRSVSSLVPVVAAAAACPFLWLSEPPAIKDLSADLSGPLTEGQLRGTKQPASFMLQIVT
jgi:hypothetical protein